MPTYSTPIDVCWHCVGSIGNQLCLEPQKGSATLFNTLPHILAAFLLTLCFSIINKAMSIILDFNGKNLAKSKPIDLHYLPAKIDGDGEANVEQYFNNYTREATEFGNGILTNSLRGYPLVGEQLKVPEQYRGLVLQETEKSINESIDRQLRLTGVFEEFTYWNYDKVPSNGDAYRQALLMADVGQALTQHISEQDVDAEIARNKENTKEHA